MRPKNNRRPFATSKSPLRLDNLVPCRLPDNVNFYGNGVVRWLIWRVVLRHPRLRLRLTKLLVRDRDLEVEILGSKLAINSIKEIGYANAAKNSRSNIVTRDEATSIINLCLLLEPGDTFIDAGANVGLYSVIMGRMLNVFPCSHYYAFEANADTCARLKVTLASLSTTIHCIALSNASGKLKFASGAVSGIFGHVASPNDFQDRGALTEVDAQRLDAFEILGGRIVLKIDVEGHEWEVLQGADRFFQEKRIKVVYLDGGTTDQITSFMTSNGFQRFDGRTLQPEMGQEFSVIWVCQDWLKSKSL